MENVTSHNVTQANPFSRTHYVQVYQDNKTLVDAICRFATEQLQPTEAVVIIATTRHRQAIQALLAAAGIPLEEATLSGQFNFFDAETLLASCTEDGQFDTETAHDFIEDVLKRLQQHYRRVRVFGETVDLLWQRGDKENATALEKLWNKFLRKYDLSVLCAYHMDNLNPAHYPSDIECLCSTHTHFLPSQETHLLDQALAKATEYVMGVSLSGMMDSIGKFRHPTTDMPAAQASLLYISKTMPITTELILNRVKMLMAKQEPAG